MSNYKIAIDSGHGSETSGKRHPDGYREHYSNTYIAYYLDQILRKNGLDTFKVSWNDNIVTDDQDIALGTRQSQVKAADCILLVSIHANAFGNGITYNSANGIETYYHSSDSYAKDSKKLANCVHEQLIKGTPQTNRKVKRANFAMCNCSAMGVNAAILIETAFMTNQKESQLLKSDSFMRETAKEIAQGIFNYLGISGNVNVTLTSADSKEPINSTNNTETKVESATIKSGNGYKLNNVPFYASQSTTTVSSRKTGTYYIWSTEVLNNRVRVTNAPNRVGVMGQVTGWVNISDLGISTIVSNNTATTTVAEQTNNKTLTAGLACKITNVSFYSSSSAKTSSTKKTGTYYVWSTEVVNGRVRMTNSKANVGKTGQITGWVNVADLGINVSNSSSSNNTSKKSIATGLEINLKNSPIYSSSSSKTISFRKTGKFYIWNSTVVNNRVRVTNAKNRVGVAGQVTGWVNVSDL